ncbi:uncharacterized protein [Hemitrygon akajei]|uniref:uncharacterized protein n=1 Tax=Hemitrygon akajei TaxID=2704970 RepID=UPI003BFA2173
MTRCNQTHQEAAGLTTLLHPRKTIMEVPKLLSQKKSILIGTWNVRSLWETGRCAQVVKEMNRYHLTLLGMCEARWNTFGETKLQTGETLLYSGKEKEEDPHEAGVALMLSKEAARSLIEWEPVSDRIITARFKSRFQKVSIILCYTPTNNTEEEEKDLFYTQLQAVVGKVPKQDMLIVMGDLNAKVGSDNTGREREMGQNSLGNMNENGELLTDFCAFNKLTIGGTLFPHRRCHKITWVSPDHQSENQIDHVIVRQYWRSSLQDVRAKRGADIGSDHHLVVAKLKMKLSAKKKQQNTQIKFDVRKLQTEENKKDFHIALQNRFGALQIEEQDERTAEHAWITFKQATGQDMAEGGGEEKLKQELNQARTWQQKQVTANRYSVMAKEVKKQLRKDKRSYFNEMAEQAETAASKGDLKALYMTTKLLRGKKSNFNRPVRDKTGHLLTSVEGQLARWKEHFQEVLNRPPPQNPPDLEPGDPLNINIGEITKQEIRKALKNLKNGKAAGEDNIPAEALKEGGEVMVDHLHILLNLIWRTGEIPSDWKKDLLVKLPKSGDLSLCGKWRGITLLSIPSKVLTRVILERMKDAIDQRLRDEQAGFRKERSCIVQIATLRVIVEQTTEWQTPLYVCFIDFEKAFDSLDRKSMWSILRHYGVPEEMVNIIKQLYDGFSCRVIHDGRLSEEFLVTTGVRQGCLLSPLLFLVVLDWVTRTAYAGSERGIQWTLTGKLEDLAFADDPALLSHRLQDMQKKVDSLGETSQRVGLKISQEKTKVLRINNKQEEPLRIEGQILEDVDKFTYLGSKISKSGGTDEDIRARIGKAQHAFTTLRPVWRSTAISVKTKLRIFSSNVKAILLYGSETWRITNTSCNKIQTFLNKCLWQILFLKWYDRVSNLDLWKRANQEPIVFQIRRRKWRWVGHTLRKSQSNVTRQSLEWNPQGKRRRGRPKQTWRHRLLDELIAAGQTWETRKIEKIFPVLLKGL